MCTCDLHTVISARDVKRESALLQSLVQKPEAVAIPQQQLDSITSSVEKQKQVSRKRIDPELDLNDSEKPDMSLTKIYWLSAKENSKDTRKA